MERNNLLKIGHMTHWKLSVDTGGTFTDCFCQDPDGTIKRLKVLSNSTLRGKIESRTAADKFSIKTNWNFDPALLQGYEIELLPGGQISKIKQADNDLLLVTDHVKDGEFTHFEIRSQEEVPVFAARLLTGTGLEEELPVVDIRLGTTRGTNALLEKAGAPVILLVTSGFGQLLEIGTQQRPDLFSLDIVKGPVFYEEVIEVTERMGANGEVLSGLTTGECERIIRMLEKYDPEKVSLAVAFLHSHKNPSHENQLTKHLQEAGFEWVSTSSGLSANSKILFRAQTTVVNAYLAPIMHRYFRSIEGRSNGSLKIMTSAGHLAGMKRFTPKDGLLSGPAGGIKGAAFTGAQCGISRMVTFDMGGTSTDVSIYDEGEDLAYETSVGGAVIQAPCLAIHTIAAGGGSVCLFDGEMLQIGPASAGAQPGPACYGGGGPLTVTDINLLAGRLNERNFSIPLRISDAEQKLSDLLGQMKEAGRETNRQELLHSLLTLTTEKMARSVRYLAIRKGVDTSGLVLITFGGAGGQHACDLAEQLSMDSVLVPYDAGLLSAHGIRTTEIAHFAEKELQQPWEEFKSSFNDVKNKLFREGKEQLSEETDSPDEIILKACYLYLRFSGQESSVEVLYTDDLVVEEEFEKSYRHVYGHWLEEKEIEITSIKVVAAIRKDSPEEAIVPDETYLPDPDGQQEMLTDDEFCNAPFYLWDELKPGASLEGPALLGNRNCTVVIREGWELVLDNRSNARMFLKERHATEQNESTASLALFTNRFSAVVEEMGAILQRTSFSVNVKERADYSCAMLDASGRLVVNAPHIPVHLGSMGECVRAVIKEMELEEGDVVITNHPKFGGSHLPDITLISPVYFEGKLMAFVANRAHHAEIGGKTPGSMPPDAKTLGEEGVIFEPVCLLKRGEAQWEQIRQKLNSGTYPSRSPDENLADLRGALASIQSGIRSVQRLCRLYGPGVISKHMKMLYEYAGDQMKEAIEQFRSGSLHACEELDDGSSLEVSIKKQHEKLLIDFQGSAGVHPGNLNATPAIVRSVVLYVMRLLIKEKLPLNEGLLRDVSLHLPGGLLNPDFSQDDLPAVVGGNTEVSQRLTDTLLKALDLAACSYGTMNNVIFGNRNFGFYETICGGTGAGPGFNGCDAVHQHMTNTRITDPEILEMRYPVRLEEFSIRPHSGGKGKWHGGNGVIRKIRFLETVELSVLTQHRTAGPYGKKGGKPGKPGKQYVVRNGNMTALAPVDYLRVETGDLFVIETPGGGGWGSQEE